MAREPRDADLRFSPVSRRVRLGVLLAALLGLVLIGLGLSFVGAAKGDGVPWQRLFGLREIWLGTFLLGLIAAQQWRIVFAFVAALLMLPLADTLAMTGAGTMAGALGWRDAARINLPYVVPLLVTLALLWPVRR